MGNIYNEKKIKRNTEQGRAERRKQLLKDNFKSSTPRVKKDIKTVKKNYNRKISVNNLFNLAICLVLLCVIAGVTRAIVKTKEEPFFNFFSTRIEDDMESLTIGINSEDITIDNVCTHEIEQKTSQVLLTVKTDYTLQYGIIQKIDKISNTEYNIFVAEDYLKQVANLLNATVVDDHVAVKLQQQDPLFVYRLQIAIDNQDFIQTVDKEKNILTYDKQKQSNLKINEIKVYGTQNINEALELFKAGEISMIYTANSNAINLLGKYDYNVYEYNSGEGIYLLGNPNSKLFSKKEVRQALTYGINKDSLTSSVALKNAEVVELPYLYYNNNYGYDIYAAKNCILTQGYTLKNGIYSKNTAEGTIKLSLDLLVNKQDSEKIQIAKGIKEDMESLGIGINILSMTKNELQDRINKGQYDIVLATITSTEVPDLSYAYNFLNINEQVGRKIEQLENAVNVEEIQQATAELIDTMSEEIACIGIYSKSSYIITNKAITLDSPNYLKVFDGFIIDK